MINLDKIYANGIAKIIPSTLSSKPPCPGKILPVSLTLAFLLIYEINKYPICQTREISKQNKKLLIESKYSY